MMSGGFMLIGVFFYLFFAALAVLVLYFVVRLAVKHAIKESQWDLGFTMKDSIKKALVELENEKLRE